MALLRNWVKSAFETLIDPEKEAEVGELTELLNREILARKRSFVLADVLKDRPCKDRHLEEAKTAVYQKFLDRAWNDGSVSPNERATLDWMARILELSESKVQSLRIDRAKPRFAEALANAMEDGEISAHEVASLTEIANAAGMSLQEFVARFFRTEGEAFLRGLFAAAVAHNQLRKDVLERIIATAAKLGLSRGDVMAAIGAQASQFIERVLADAKEDGVLSVDEERTLRQWLDWLDVQRHTRAYALSELAHLRLMTDIKNGKLPVIAAPAGLSVESGELVHFHGRAVWHATKMLKSGPSTAEHSGFLTITDSRLIFVSQTRSEAFSYSRVVRISTHGAIELEIKGKPTQRFACAGNWRIPAAILASAVAMANRTLTNSSDCGNPRHIPRDVRQRVWQRYQGKCAECGAKEYLEFDHIIPVAKGGGNSEANIQLLCRHCNLKKLDRI